jgi:hypothetical protein
MKIEDQVCTEFQADRLKEFGIIQESLFYHTHSDWGVMPRKSIDFSGNPSSSFSVAELGIMLPPGYDTMYCTNDGWRGFDLDGQDMCDSKPFDTEAEARAAMLIYLLENNTITPAEVNERLKDKQ